MSALVTPGFATIEIRRWYESHPATLRDRLVKLRALIFHTAETIAAVGALSESLKWGEPSYTPSTKNIAFALALVASVAAVFMG